MKANSSFAVVRLLREAGSAVDANSIGEVELAMRAGFAPSDIVFSGVGKSPDEIERAVQLGLKAINAESAGELERIDRAAQARGQRARVAVRVNPDIDAGTHPHISTGLHINKFGVPLEQAGALYRKMSGQPGLQPVGIHVHLGSQIISTEPLQRGAAAVVRLARELRDAGIPARSHRRRRGPGDFLRRIARAHCRRVRRGDSAHRGSLGAVGRPRARPLSSSERRRRCSRA